MRRYPVERYLADPAMSIRAALQQIEETERRTLFVVDQERRLRGSVTDGDIRRWLIGGGDINAPLADVLNPHPLSVGADYDRDSLSVRLVELGATCVPVVDAQQRVVDVAFWEDVVMEPAADLLTSQVDALVVIMAGGRGTRMEPFTQVLPKPLLPIGDKTIVELVIERFVKHGVRRFLLTVNYKANLLKAFFQDLPAATRSGSWRSPWPSAPRAAWP
ncbi:MAG: sugar phosphate nucleotidyltransferase [Candidatus Krumholzibacteriia bacterium]